MTRTSDVDLVVRRTFGAPARAVFTAWTSPALLLQWWVPRSSGLTFLSCEADARTGGSYRFVFKHDASAELLAFFGRYLEVVPDARLVWTNEEAGSAGAVTTVTFTEADDGTAVELHETYPSKGALDETVASGSPDSLPENFDQLDVILAGLS